MWSEQIQRIAKLAQVRYQQGQLLVIAVDGCGGAGKSTLCRALAAEIEPWAHTQLLQLDNFYHPLSSVQRAKLHHAKAREAYFNAAEFKKNLLSPLCKGIIAGYKPFHWLEGESDQVIKLAPSGVLLLDGVFSFSRPLREMVGLSLFVDTPLLLRKQRLIERPQLDIEWVNHWQITESWHHQQERTSKATEFVVSGTQG